jgi:hypothetical protein
MQLSEAESCNAIYTDLRPPWILAREAIHNKHAVGEPKSGQPALATRRSFPALPDTLPGGLPPGVPVRSRFLNAHSARQKADGLGDRPSELVGLTREFHPACGASSPGRLLLVGHFSIPWVIPRTEANRLRTTAKVPAKRMMFPKAWRHTPLIAGQLIANHLVFGRVREKAT